MKILIGYLSLYSAIYGDKSGYEYYTNKDLPLKVDGTTYKCNRGYVNAYLSKDSYMGTGKKCED